MKKSFSIITLLLLSLCAFAQQTYVMLVQDTVAKTYRFQRIEVRSYETVSDTLITDRFPEKWLTAAELKTYQEQLLGSYNERFAELSRLRKVAKDEMDVHIGYYDQLNGEGAWLRLQKANLLAALQGNWVLIERNGETTRTDITVKNYDFRKNAQKFGTLAIADDLTVTLSGYFNFNLTFAAAGDGLKAERNGRIYFLKKK